jgi:hypothetical protein
VQGGAYSTKISDTIVPDMAPSFVIIKLLAEMPGVARAGFRTHLASVVPSLTLSLSVRIHGRIDKRTDHKSHHLFIVVAAEMPGF